MFNKPNMLGMLKQAQQAKKQLKKVQKEIDRMVFKGYSKDNIVVATEAAFINALATAVPAMTALAPVLPIIAFSFLMMGAALWVLAQGIKAFMGEGMIGAMLLAAATIVIFGYIMLQAAPIMIAAGMLTGLGAAILGAGLWMLGTGIQQFVGEGMLGAMLLVALTLGIFGLLLIFVAMPFIFGGYLVGIGALVLGVGLWMLGKGIGTFVGEGMLGAMLLVALTLGLFGILLIFYAYPFIIGGYLVGVGAIALGIGLCSLGGSAAQTVEIISRPPAFLIHL